MLSVASLGARSCFRPGSSSRAVVLLRATVCWCWGGLCSSPNYTWIEINLLWRQNAASYRAETFRYATQRFVTHSEAWMATRRIYQLLHFTNVWRAIKTDSFLKWWLLHLHWYLLVYNLQTLFVSWVVLTAVKSPSRLETRTLRTSIETFSNLRVTLCRVSNQM
jgi:hypothetical protein